MARRNPFNGLSEFLAVAKSGSFRRAAHELGVTPGAVSQAIQGFEARLRQPLFHRTTRSVALTEAGERLLERVRPAAGVITESLDDLLADGKPGVLVFVSTTCGPCLQMLPTLSRWQNTLAPRIAIAAVFAGQSAEISRLSSENELTLVVAEERADTFERYKLRATPSAVLIGPDGTVGESPAEGLPAIEILIRAGLARSEPSRELVEDGSAVD